MKELDISELANESTAAGLVKEATQKQTYPTGTYKMRFEKAVAFENEDTRQKTGQFSGTIFRTPPKGQVGEETFAGRHTFYASWEGARNEKGALTGESKRWGLLVKALGLDESTPIPKVFSTALEFPVMIRLSEAYRIEGPGGEVSFVNAPHRNPSEIPDEASRTKAQEYAERFVREREARQAQGDQYILMNFTQNIWKVS